jgi:hypothetical protein
VGVLLGEALNIVVKRQRTNVQKAISYYTTFWNFWLVFAGIMGLIRKNFKVRAFSLLAELLYNNKKKIC